MRENDDRSAPLGCSSSSSSFASPSASCHNRGGVGIAPRGREYILGYKEKQSVSSPFHNNAILMPHSPAGGSETRVSRLGLSRGALFPRHFSLPLFFSRILPPGGKEKFKWAARLLLLFFCGKQRQRRRRRRRLSGKEEEEEKGGEADLSCCQPVFLAAAASGGILGFAFPFNSSPFSAGQNLRASGQCNVKYKCISHSFPEKEILLSHFKLSCKRPNNSKH